MKKRVLIIPVLAAILIGCGETDTDQRSRGTKPTDPATVTEEAKDQVTETEDLSSGSSGESTPEAEEAVAETAPDVIEEAPLPAEDTASEVTDPGSAEPENADSENADPGNADPGNADSDLWQIDYDHPFAPITEATVFIMWDESDIDYFGETGQFDYFDGICAPVVEIEGASVEREIQQDGTYHIEYITINDITDHVRITMEPCVPSNNLPYETMEIEITDWVGEFYQYNIDTGFDDLRVRGQTGIWYLEIYEQN